LGKGAYCLTGNRADGPCRNLPNISTLGTVRPCTFAQPTPEPDVSAEAMNLQYRDRNGVLDRASKLPILATWKAICREPRYAGNAGILPAWGRPWRIRKARRVP